MPLALFHDQFWSDTGVESQGSAGGGGGSRQRFTNTARGRTQYEDGKPVRKKKKVRRIPEVIAEELYGPPPVVTPKPLPPIPRPSVFVAAAPPVEEPPAPTAESVLDTPNYLAIWQQKRREEENDDEEAINAAIETLLGSL